jgi:hypothetical protein
MDNPRRIYQTLEGERTVPLTDTEAKTIKRFSRAIISGLIIGGLAVAYSDAGSWNGVYSSAREALDRIPSVAYRATAP